MKVDKNNKIYLKHYLVQIKNYHQHRVNSTNNITEKIKANIIHRY